MYYGVPTHINFAFPGCIIFDKFMASDSEADIYGRMCKCLAAPDVEGRPIMVSTQPYLSVNE